MPFPKAVSGNPSGRKKTVGLLRPVRASQGLETWATGCVRHRGQKSSSQFVIGRRVGTPGGQDAPHFYFFLAKAAAERFEVAGLAKPGAIIERVEFDRVPVTRISFACKRSTAPTAPPFCRKAASAGGFRFPAGSLR
jgi:hypothetical protein